MIARRGLLGGAALLAPLSFRPGHAQPSLAALETRLDDTVAPGLRRGMLIRWGDRVEFDAQPFAPATPGAEAAEAQFGWDARVIGAMAPPGAADGAARAVLVVAHPTVEPALAAPPGRLAPEIALALQGASVLNLELQAGRWVVVDGGFQMRRLHGRTLCRIAGPARGAMGGSVQGIVGARGGCVTPWGTALLTEGHLGAWEPVLRARRMPEAAFGWVVEFDPLEPQSVPAKRTALGRIAHGDAAAALSRDGRAVVYLVDRRPGGALYRFVSAGAAGPDALDDGTLSAARIEGESLRWIALPEGAGAADPAALAARTGATPLDVPAGLSADPRAPRLFLACRGGAGTGAGRVLEIIPAAGDHAAETGAALVLLTGRPVPPAPDPNARRRPAPVAAWPDAPETVFSDGQGDVLVGTDREGRAGAYPDVLYACDTGARRGRCVPLYGAPRGAGLGGVALLPDRRSLAIGVRRPGAEIGASWDRPATGWPEFTPGVPPRSAVLTLARDDGRPF